MLEHKGQHLGSAVEVGVDLLGWDYVADDVVQVGPGGVSGVGDAVSFKDLIVGDPDPAPRSGRRSPEVGGLLHHHGG